jgi:predicted TPR repeat methyltransferase
VTDLLERTGFSLLEIRKTTIRKDAGKPLSGILFVARAKA